MNSKNRYMVLLVLALILIFTGVLVFQSHHLEEKVPVKMATPANFKVAFIADQGLGENARAVLLLIRNEQANMVLHQGDFDYRDNPDVWDKQITDILGPAFPYFAAVGNHDLKLWSQYQQKLQHRLSLVPTANCTGELGVKSACHYQGLFFILSGAGTLGNNHKTFLHKQLQADNALWKICSWHKNQNAMQMGNKSNDTGWKVYEECRKAGAMIVTGHEHSYQRTKTLKNIRVHAVDTTCADDPATPDIDVCVGKGQTFVVVSGLGGKSIRQQQRCFPDVYPYGCEGDWAKIYTSNQNAQYGALFITFNVDGIPGKARGYFRNIDGKVIDTFTITAR